MSSKSETGHTKNVSNLKTLNGYLASLGAQYNPTKNSIVLAQLQALHTNAEKALSDIQNAFFSTTFLHKFVFGPRTLC